MKTRDDIILLLLKNIDPKFSINEIAKNIGKSPSGVFKELRRLEKENFVCGRKIGNSKIYELNLDNIETKKISELLLLKERSAFLSKPLANKFSNAVAQLENFADIIAIFEKEEPRSVGTLLVSVEKNIKDVEDICKKISSIHRKPFSPQITNFSEFVSAIQKRDADITEIIKRSIVLKGCEKFVEAIKHGNA